MQKTFNECPKCGGTDLERNISGAWFNKEEQTLKLETECENCGGEFEEVYKFIGSKNYQKDEVSD